MVMENRVFFSVRDIQYKQHCDGWTITVTSNIPCHLFMRYSTVEPQIHDIPRYIRGIFLHGDRYFCFVAFHDNEQEEAGDTVVHTFIKRPWPICERRYFYFWGSVGRQTSVSTTAIFSLHFNISWRELTNKLSNISCWTSLWSWSYCHDAAVAMGFARGGAPEHLLTAGCELTASYFIYRNFLSFDTSSLPADRPPLGGFISLFVDQVWKTSSVSYPNIYATKGVQDDPVTLENYGDQLPLTTIAGEKDLRDFTIGEYNNIPLNDFGISLITPGGLTNFCLRGQQDVIDRAPTLGSNLIRFRAEQAGGDYRPLLTLCLPVA